MTPPEGNPLRIKAREELRPSERKCAVLIKKGTCVFNLPNVPNLPLTRSQKRGVIFENWSQSWGINIFVCTHTP
jgi:hypothetical protein